MVRLGRVLPPLYPPGNPPASSWTLASPPCTGTVISREIADSFLGCTLSPRKGSTTNGPGKLRSGSTSFFRYPGSTFRSTHRARSATNGSLFPRCCGGSAWLRRAARHKFVDWARPARRRDRCAGAAFCFVAGPCASDPLDACNAHRTSRGAQRANGAGRAAKSAPFERTRSTACPSDTAGLFCALESFRATSAFRSVSF